MRQSFFGRVALGALVALWCGAARGGPVHTYVLAISSTPVLDAGGKLIGTDYAFNAVVSLNDPSAFDGATLNYPGPGNPQPYTKSGQSFTAEGLFTNRSTLNAAYPFGTYSTTLTNSVSGASTTLTIQYNLDATPGPTPVLSPASLQGLQGLNPSRAYTLQFNSFLPDPQASRSFTDVFIQGSSTSDIPVNAVLSPGATNYTIAANTLAPDKRYTLAVYFENDVQGIDGSVLTSVDFFNFVQLNIVTGPAVVIPEPTGLALAVVCLGTLALRRARA